MIKTFKVKDFTIDLDDESRLVGSSIPGFVKKMKSRLSEPESDDIVIIDETQKLYFHFYAEEYVHIFPFDKLSDRERMMLFMLSEVIDDVEVL